MVININNANIWHQSHAKPILPSAEIYSTISKYEHLFCCLMIVSSHNSVGIFVLALVGMAINTIIWHQYHAPSVHASGKKLFGEQSRFWGPTSKSGKNQWNCETVVIIKQHFPCGIVISTWASVPFVNRFGAKCFSVVRLHCHKNMH